MDGVYVASTWHSVRFYVSYVDRGVRRLSVTLLNIILSTVAVVVADKRWTGCDDDDGLGVTCKGEGVIGMQVKTAKGFDWDLKGINVSISSAAVHAPGSCRITLIQG